MADYSRMKVFDLSNEVIAKGVESVEAALLQREFQTPFEMYRVPPVRGMVARLGDQDHAIILMAHHVRAHIVPFLFRMLVCMFSPMITYLPCSYGTCMSVMSAVDACLG